MNNEIPSILLFIDQAIENHEEELERLRKARVDLTASPNRRRGRPPKGSGDSVLAASQQVTESVGTLLMDGLREKGQLTVKQIHRWVIAKGKIANYHTVSSMVNYYFRQKYIKRVAPGTYAIADEALNGGAPKPEIAMKNGAPVPKAMR